MLKVRELTAGYKFPVVRGVSFEVARGEVFAVVGPNASGKSTLLKSIAGLVRRFSGSVELDGKPLRPEAVAYVPAEERPRVALSVLEYAALGRAASRLGWRAKREDLEAAYGALEALGITHLAERSLAELSTGQRQLAAIAQALAKEPEVLLLDEPTSALDLKYQIKAMRAVAEYVRRRKAVVVLVHHDLNLASEFSDKMGLMKNGRLIALGAPEEVLVREALEEAYEVPIEVVEVNGKRKVFPSVP